MNTNKIEKMDVKSGNRFAILDTLRKKGAMSRKEISQEIGLTPAAVTNLTSELIEEGIIREVAEVDENRVGRKSILIDIDHKSYILIGVYIDITGIELAATYLDGELIVRQKKPLKDIAYHENVTEKIAKECKEFISDNITLKRNEEKIVYIGLSIVGAVDEESGLSKGSFGILPQGEEIKANLERKLRLPVAVENNVRALAMAEIDFNNEEYIENALFIKHGPGVGSAIIINRNIYRGSTNVAGEIGHIYVKDNDKECICGKKGCLETVIGESYIIDECKKVFSIENTNYLYNLCHANKDFINLHNILLAAENGDKQIKAILDDALKYLAIAIDNTLQLIDVEEVILFGLAFQNNYFHKTFKKHLEDINSNRRYNIEYSNLNVDQEYKGCSAIASRSFLRMIS